MLREVVRFDGQKIESIMKRYSGASGAHLGYITDDQNHSQIIIGGRLDLEAMGMSTIMARMAMITLPRGKRESIIDEISAAAKDMLKEMEDSEDMAERG